MPEQTKQQERRSTQRIRTGWLVCLSLLGLSARVDAQSLPKAPEAKAPEAPAAPEGPAAPETPEAPAPPPFAGMGGGEGGDEEEEEPPPESGGPPGLPPELSGQGPDSEALTVEEESSALTIEELVNSLVVSASNREETSLTAPAWVITLTAEDLRKRGYNSLDEVLDDLPGIDVSRPYGDVYFKDAWRGYRNVIGAPYLLLLDGVSMNHLWYENTQVMTTFPMSEIERVEILFGPASAVYGPNAAMGVVNVITKKDRQEDGVSVTSRFSVASPQRSYFAASDLRKIGDMHALLKKGDLRFSLGARFDYGVLDPNIANNFEYTKTRYYRDRTLWGDFVDRPSLGGSFQSPSEKLALDARIYYGNTEAAVQFFQLTNGNGTVYPADQVQTNPPITYQDTSFYLRHTEVMSTVSSTSLLRYRTSDVENPTSFLGRIAAPGTADDGALFFEQDKANNFSVTAQQDFRVSIGRNLIMTDDELFFDFGGKYEYKDLQRDFDRTLTFIPAADINDVNFDMLAVPPSPGLYTQNRQPANNTGGYLLGKYHFLDKHWLNLGMRTDYRSLVHSTSVVFRGGYIGQFFESLTAKLLYGQATQEPTARELFAVVGGNSANPDLKLERSQTLELNLNYVIQWIALVGDIYWANYKDPIIGAGKTFTNVGKRDVAGLDLGLQALPPLDFLRQLKFWAYYSTYLYAKESSFVPPTATEEASSGKKIRIGDISHHKVLGGLTVDFTRQVSATLLGRWFSERRTVRSNPIRSVDGYFTLDANLLFSDIMFNGLMMDIRCTNLIDAKYYHPGIKSADSGDTPGTGDSGSWVGSVGAFNSLLPQPGRAFTITLGMNI